MAKIVRYLTDHPLFAARETLPCYLQAQVSTLPVDILHTREVSPVISHHSQSPSKGVPKSL
jgi:hypothetical protein